MCYAIPGKVLKIEGKTVTVDYFGEEKTAVNELHHLAVGDYIYAQGGFVIEQVPPDTAREVLEAWRDVFFHLREIDVRLSRLPVVERGVTPAVARLLDRAMEGRPLKREELLSLLSLPEGPDNDLLASAANFLRQKHQKNACCVHGILELSNICRRNCGYCGIAAGNGKLARYRMSREEILAAVEEAVTVHGFRALVLQGGEGAYPVSVLAAIIREIKERFAVLVFVSCGEIGRPGLEELYEAGARGLLLRFETSNPALYGSLHPGFSLESRLRDLRDAFEIGYLIITGGLIGLPGQSDGDILNDILLAGELHAEMYSFGPFLPHPATPLCAAPPPPSARIIKTLAVTRLTDPAHARILVTTGLETLDGDARRKALLAGANSVMLNVTPLAYRRLYSIYPGRAHGEEAIPDQIAGTIALLKALGRSPTDLGTG